MHIILCIKDYNSGNEEVSNIISTTATVTLQFGSLSKFRESGLDISKSELQSLSQTWWWFRPTVHV